MNFRKKEMIEEGRSNTQEGRVCKGNDKLGGQFGEDDDHIKQQQQNIYFGGLKQSKQK